MGFLGFPGDFWPFWALLKGLLGIIFYFFTAS